MMRVNLIPQSRLQARVVRTRVRRWSWIVGGYVAILGITWLVTSLPAADRSAEVAAQLVKLNDRIAAGTREQTEIQAAITRTMRSVETAQAVSDHPDWSVLLRAIAGVRGEDVLLESVKLDRRVETPATPPAGAKPVKAAANAKGAAPPAPKVTYSLTLGGLGLTQSAVVKFVRRLEDLGALDTVHIKQTRTASFEGTPAVGFELECTTGDQKVTGVTP